MILWDRIKKNFDNGVETVQRVSQKVSERTRIEAAVARLMIEKGGLETRLDRLNRRLGERVSHLWEQKGRDVMKDPEVVETLRGIAELKERISALQLNIRKVSLGEEEE